MKVALLVEDRDTGYLFLDAETAPPDAQQLTLELDGVTWEETSDERLAVWLLKDTANSLRVVPYGSFDFAAANFDEVGCPIPSPIVVLDMADYERHLAQ